jgi:RHS repeat-associated protein
VIYGTHSAVGALSPRERDGVLGRGTPIESPFRLLGQVADEDAELCWTRFRVFDAEVGGWLSADPLGTRGGLNLHAYVPAPSNAVDPLGLTTGASGDGGNPHSGEAAAGDPLVRRGTSRESAARLERQAQAAEQAGVAQNGVPYGHGVSVTTPAANARLSRNPEDASTATRAAFENAGFPVRHTPTRADPTHHTVQLPSPVTPADADRFNDVLGRTR